jgi:hypothetical protein
MMKLVLVSLLLALPAMGANRYVRTSSAGSNNGTDWNNAWNMTSLNANWASVSAGDTIWMAGGTYTTGMVMGKSGASGNPILIKRPLATDATPTAAAGWSSGFDSQVIIAPSSALPISWTALNVGSYVTFDGRVDSGIRCALDNSGAGDPYPGAVCFVRSSAGGQTDISFNNMDLAGPAPNSTAFNYGTQYKCGVSLDAGWNANQKLTNISFSHCRIHGGADLVIIVNGVSILFEYCKFYDNVVQSGPTAPHDNMFEVNECAGFIMRYCELYHWAVEGFRPYGNVSNVEIYGNLWRDTVNSVGRCIEPDSSVGSSWGPLKLYNNTFANVQLTIISQGGFSWTFASGSEGKNNLSYNADTVGSSFGLTVANNISAVSGKFLNVAADNYHLASATSAGTTLSSPYNADADGITRGADGTWDIGAFEFPATDTTPPTLSSATIPSAGNVLNLVFSEPVTFGAGGNAGWSFTMSGGAVTATYSSGSGSSTLVYALSRTVNSGETKTAGLNYTQPGNGVEDSAGNDLVTISGASVVNNSTQDTVAPTLSSATIPSAGNVLNLGFSEPVTFGAGGNAGWSFTMSGGAVTATYSSGSGSSTLVYALSRTVNSGETKTAGLNYTQPGNGVEDSAGNDLATVSGAAVTNNSGAGGAAAPSFKSAGQFKSTGGFISRGQ